ncbi:hypothetical protein DSO57_1003740 [Entomophthora muscae]|uniref:Uncharacterized protein n=1 Tax=Entomophthora muscae TaxID=34485 RepID=A0ACC2SY65_9FUNG|nr:hypothetical protein DSO57_1003740 [Entomophthora muscae]
MPPAQDFSKLGFVYITVLRLANQVMPHTGSWYPLATAVNYLVQIMPIVYMAFRAWPASSVGAQPDSGMGCDNLCRCTIVGETWLPAARKTSVICTYGLRILCVSITYNTLYDKIRRSK